MAITVVADDGVQLPLDSIDQVFGYNGSDITSITVEYYGNTYIQTITYSSGNVTSISKWVKQ